MTFIEYEPVGGVAAILSSIDAKITHLANLEPLMIEAQAIVYEHTEAWFHSNGEGSWPGLAPSTVASKEAHGMDQPTKPLYAYGNLFHSVTSPSGPYSWTTPLVNGIGFGIHWTSRGYQPADVLAAGSKTGRSKIPARPIWPPPTSGLGLAMMKEIGQLFLHGNGGTIVNRTPAFPGANSARSAGGRFVSFRTP